MSGEGPTQVTTTNRDYDLAETSKAIRSVLMGCLFVRGALSLAHSLSAGSGEGEADASVCVWRGGTDGGHAPVHEVHAAALHPGHHAPQGPLRLQGASSLLSFPRWRHPTHSLPPPTLPSSPQILKIHLFNKPATGDLKRPFEAPPGLFAAAAAGAGNNKTDAAAVEEPAKVEAKKTK